jgi:hypothetical protein
MGAARRPIYKLQYLHSNNSGRTTEIYLKELILGTMRTTASDGPNRPKK